eukprot:7585178-Prorocentrum_lima.AAC.1
MEVILGWKLYEGNERFDRRFIESPVPGIAVKTITYTSGQQTMDIDVYGDSMFDWMRWDTTRMVLDIKRGCNVLH